MRGLAILLVLVFHFNERFRPLNSIDNHFHELLWTGWCGVDLFFVLSGFLITGILYDAKVARHFFRNFYIRRTLRIFPLYYGYLVLMLLIMPWLGHLPEPGRSQLLHNQAWYWTYTTNFLIALNGTWTVTPFRTNHVWSLAIEEQFYICWPLVVFLCARRRLLLVCGACLFGSMLIRLGMIQANVARVSIYVFTPARLDGLAMGSFLAVAARDPSLFRVLARLARWLTLVAALVLAGLFLARSGFAIVDDYVQCIGFSALAWFFGGLLICTITAVPGGVLFRIFNHRLLMSFGKYSYALYLFHGLLIEVGLYLGRRTGISLVTLTPRLFGSQIPGLLLSIVLGSAVAFGVAWLSWNLYEKHFLKLKTFFPL